MVPISKSIYIHTSLEYCQPFLNESTVKFLIRWQKTFSGIVQNPPLPKFSARFCARCSILSKNLLFVQFCCTRKPLHRDGTVEGLQEKTETFYGLRSFSGFCRALLGSMNEDGQHGHGKEDAYGVRHSGVVDGGTLTVLLFSRPPRHSGASTK